MKSQWMTYKGVKFLYADYTNFGFDSEGLKIEQDYVVSLASGEPLGSVRTLTDVRGTKASPEIYALMRNTSERLNPYVCKRAVVGVTGLQRTFLDLINKMAGKLTYTNFDELETAKDWLVEG